MRVSVFKLTWRGIRSFFGRFAALLLIVALSVGFFAGLKITKAAMANTCGEYLEEQNFYDFRLISTVGFSEETVKELRELPYVELAESAGSADVLLDYQGDQSPYKLLAMPEEVSLPSLAEGRMPEKETECVADAKAFDAAAVGTQVRIAEDSEDTVTGRLTQTEYTIVGLVNSPLYLNSDRGMAGIGSGALEGFLYLPAEVFSDDRYMEIQLTLREKAPAYSEEYDSLIEEYKGEITEVSRRLAGERYEELLAENGLTEETAEQLGISGPEVYVLTRRENAGYVSFENDTSIISGIANIFPVFFILIAMLVCITTMTRMVDEERTQIGVMKAMGFGSAAISGKYLLYAGSATILGWGLGFFLGTWGLPEVFWLAYSSLYDFAPMRYLFQPGLAVGTLLVALLGILGSTYLSCRKELCSVPAKLIRPRSVKNGKRIFLERITPVWSRLSFLHKVTLRNMFRYKRRLIMMLVGIGCCAGLVVTAFGVRDSMIDIGTLQFGGVQKYQMEASFTEGTERELYAELERLDGIDGYLACSVLRVDLRGERNMNSVNLYSFADTEQLSGFWDFHKGEETVPFPEAGEVIVSSRVAERLSLSPGDNLEILNTDRQKMTVRVAGIFDNYIDNFVIADAGTVSGASRASDASGASDALIAGVSGVGKTETVLQSARRNRAGVGEWEANTLLLSTGQDTAELAEALTDIEEITSVVRLSATKDSVDSALSCLNYIIWLIVLFSGVLAFIVIFNLTNINLAERRREVATVQVLGFYPGETEGYVLRENLFLSIAAAFIGLPLGTLFHRIVMHQIVIDSMSFDIHVTAGSYVLSLCCTILFAVVVNLFMRRQIEKIPMAESLKAVE